MKYEKVKLQIQFISGQVRSIDVENIDPSEMINTGRLNCGNVYIDTNKIEAVEVIGDNNTALVLTQPLAPYRQN